MAEDTDWFDLATYNSEAARGLVHTDEWKARMELEQRRFDFKSAARPR